MCLKSLLRIGLVAVAFGLVLLLRPASVAAQRIIIDPPEPRNMPSIQLDEQTINVEIDGPIAKVTMTQLFHNTGARTVQGHYLFPLPADATVSDFQMEVDGTLLEGQLYPKDEARRIYQQIVRAQKDPALLEYFGQGLFQTSVFPLPPGATRTLTFSYTYVLPREQGLFRLAIPLHSSTPPRAEFESSIEVQIRNHPGLRTIYSVNHPVEIDRTTDATAAVTLDASTTARDTPDFVLYFGSSQGAIGANLLDYRPADEDGYFLLLLTPGLETEPTEVVARDIVLVLDISGSMTGAKLEQAQAAAAYVLQHLNPGDRVNVIAFSTGVRLWARALQPATESAVAQAVDWVGTLAADSSTDINLALLEALNQFAADDTRPAYVLFLTDGQPTMGVMETPQIVDNALANVPADRSVRLFTFGIGFDVHTDLLDTLSRELGGRSNYVLPNERIDEAVSAFYNSIDTPVLADIIVDFGEDIVVEEMLPARLPDLFAGEQLVVTGRYRIGDADQPIDLIVRGQVNGQSRSYHYPDQSFRAAGGEAFVARLWATRKIGLLLAELRRRGPERELIDAIIELSKRYGIVTPYTSYLVVEPNTTAASSWIIRQPRGSADGAAPLDPRNANIAAAPATAADSLARYAASAPAGEAAVKFSLERSRRIHSGMPAATIRSGLTLPMVTIRTTTRRLWRLWCLAAMVTSRWQPSPR